jgi:putative transposase
MALALQREGHSLGRYQVRSLMREAGVECRQRRRYRAITDSVHGRPIAPNHPARQFAVAEHVRAQLALSALEMALGRRRPPRGLLHKRVSAAT